MKKEYNYLVLLLSAAEFQLYLYDNVKFESIKIDAENNVNDLKRDMPEKVGNFSDAHDKKEMLTDKFLYQIDKALSEVLNEHHVPLFILGAKKTTGHFKQISKHNKHITECIDGNYMLASLPELKELLAPHIRALDFVKEVS
jgi:hypothetical protein